MINCFGGAAAKQDCLPRISLRPGINSTAILHWDSSGCWARAEPDHRRADSLSEYEGKAALLWPAGFHTGSHLISFLFIKSLILSDVSLHSAICYPAFCSLVRTSLLYSFNPSRLSRWLVFIHLFLCFWFTLNKAVCSRKNIHFSSLY